jgi:hypothetical protein
MANELLSMCTDKNIISPLLENCQLGLELRSVRRDDAVMAPIYEYKIIEIVLADVAEDELNDHARDGWRVIHAWSSPIAPGVLLEREAVALKAVREASQ